MASGDLCRKDGDSFSTFFCRSDGNKKRVKDLGPNCPDLNIRQQTTDAGRTYTRSFSSNMLAKRNWLAGCPVGNGFFVSPVCYFKVLGLRCWTTTGMKDSKHFTEKAKKHECSRSHLDNSLKLNYFGRLSIAEQLNEGYRIGIRKHNEEVTKNRHILSRIIVCEILWCI